MQILERTVGTTTRLRVRDADGHRFMKQPSALWRARVITEISGITAAELRFYRELAAELPVRLPRFVRGRHGLFGFELVLEDLVTEGCTLVRSGDAIPARELARFLPVLASLHARFWEDPRFDGELRWLTDMRRREVRLGRALARPLMELGLARAGDLVPREVRDGARRYASERRRVDAILARGPRTLVHHDCHPGNLFFDRDDEPGLLDWQLVRTGSWASDIAYLFATGLSTGERRSCADDMLRRYLPLLPDAVRPSFDDARELVSLHTSYAFEAMIVTLALGGLMIARDVRALVERTALAVADTKSYERLGL